MVVMPAGGMIPMDAEQLVAMGLRATANEVQSEKDALSAYGVYLKDDHFDGYQWKGNHIIQDRSAVKKPWEQTLLEQMGPAPVVYCETLEGWNNEDFLFEVREGIAYLTLNRPAANNAMNDTIGGGLHDATRILRNRPDIRIVVLTGNGRMFCAGGDPKSFQAAQAGAGAIQAEAGGGAAAVPKGSEIAGAAGMMSGNTAGAQMFARSMLDLATLPQFTICCMNGSAMGGGVGLVSACDMCVAVRTAHATLSEVKLGVIPAVISPHVIRTIGTANSKRLFCSAENANMQMAMECGLVQRIVNDTSEFPAVIKEIAKKLQGCAPGAVAAAKQTILSCLNQPFSEAMIKYTAREYTRIRTTKECEEGMKALSEKKKPSWVNSSIDVKES